MKSIIRGGNIVTENGVMHGDLLISDGKVAQIETKISDSDAVSIEADGLYVLPGGIDAHTHFDLDTGVTKTADDFTSGSRAAITGGTTTIVDFATQDKGKSLQDALTVWHAKAAGNCYCDYGFHMAVTDWNEAIKAEIAQIVAQGIPTFKMYMAYKNTLQVDDAVICEALVTAQKENALIGFHCENGDLIDCLIKTNLRAGQTEPKYHMLSRPAVLEAEAINRLLIIAELAKAPVWVVHLSTAAGLELIQRAKQSGQEIITETCPQYLLLDESAYDKPDFEAAKYVISPPLRTQEDQEALWAGIADGSIDFVSTDHCSFNFKGQKELGKNDFSKIPNGGPGVEDRMLLLYTYGVCEGRFGIEKMAELFASAPARKMGLNNKGSLAVGKDADIVLLNPQHEDVFCAATQTQRVDYNAYEGMKRKGKIEKVFLRGELVVDNGRVCSEHAGGKFQTRRRI